ncbi:MAG: 8-amino-7-oxononanoate synthase [Chlamydiae bacterium]|nr:8-amino-7-oxononanoate synthase [Chlamydiota bacterium]
MNSLKEELNILKGKNRYRSFKTVEKISGPIVRINGKKLINFASNNYLGLAHRFSVRWAALRATWQFGTGAGASRLVSGHTVFHEALEDALAKFKGVEAVLLYPTGYMANLGAISTLIGPDDLIILDRFNHASIIEAAQLSRAKIWVYPHRDVKRLEEILKKAESQNFKNKWVITETLFSMDGDIAPLKEILNLCQKYNAHLMIDEAHATGVLGKTGKGALEHFSINPREVDVVMGTLSKALGSLGGFIGGKRETIDYLRNKSKSFIYTTALPAGVCASALKALEMIQGKNSPLQFLRKNTEYFFEGLKKRGLESSGEFTPIIPIIIGDDRATLAVEDFLKEQGTFAPAIRPPTVPEGKGRIRLSLMASHTQKHLDQVLEIIGKIKKDEHTSASAA